MLSINNLSIDLFNIGGNIPRVNGRPYHGDHSDVQSQSVDDTEMMDLHSDMMDEGPAANMQSQMNDGVGNVRRVHIDNVEDIVGVLFGGNSRPRFV